MIDYTKPIYYNSDETFEVINNYLPYQVLKIDPLYEELIKYKREYPSKIINRPIRSITSEMKASEIRRQRDFLLQIYIDKYNAIRWECMSDIEKQVVKKYRQELLDITKQKTFPNSVNWPIKPE